MMLEESDILLSRLYWTSPVDFDFLNFEESVTVGNLNMSISPSEFAVLNGFEESLDDGEWEGEWDGECEEWEGEPYWEQESEPYNEIWREEDETAAVLLDSLVSNDLLERFSKVFEWVVVICGMLLFTGDEGIVGRIIEYSPSKRVPSSQELERLLMEDWDSLLFNPIFTFIEGGNSRICDPVNEGGFKWLLESSKEEAVSSIVIVIKVTVWKSQWNQIKLACLVK